MSRAGHVCKHAWSLIDRATWRYCRVVDYADGKATVAMFKSSRFLDGCAAATYRRQRRDLFVY